MTWLRCLTLWCLSFPALAGADLAPFNGSGGVQVADTGKTAKVFYPVDPGSNLDYAFSGPGRVWVYVRSGARPKGNWSYPRGMELTLEILSTRIDGVPLAPALDGAGMLVDSTSDYPWLSKGILLDVPEGSTSFRLQARLDGPPLLVRVMVPGNASEPAPVADDSERPTEGPEAPVADIANASQDSETEAPVEAEPALISDFFNGNEDSPEPLEATPTESAVTNTDTASETTPNSSTAAPDDEEERETSVQQDAIAAPPAEDSQEVPEIIDAVPEELVGEPAFGGEYEIFDESAQELEIPKTQEEDVVDLSAEEVPEAVELGSLQDRIAHSLKSSKVAATTGVGAPIRGSQAIATAGLSARAELLPVLTDAWSAGWGRMDLEFRVEWYRLGVNETLSIDDAISGPIALNVAYASHVVPIQLGIHYDVPIRLGPAWPFAGLGGGISIVQRSGETSSQALVGSWYAKAGVELPVGPVHLLPSFSYSGAEATLNRVDSSGSLTPEDLSCFRLDLAVQTQF